MKKKLLKTIRVTIVGEPNVGKSSLINKIIKKKISIVTRKSQTTKKQKAGAIIYQERQFIFLDTPGIFGKQERLLRSTFKQASNAIIDSDLVLILVNSVKPNIDKVEEIIRYITIHNKDFLVVVNKIDLLNKSNFFKKIEFIKSKFNAKNLITISAIRSTGINTLLKYIYENYNFSYKQTFDVVDQLIKPEFIEEVVREKVLENIHDEVPYNLYFKTDDIIKNKDKSYNINLSIYFNKQSHKPIIIGKGGKNIKQISTNARIDLEKFYKKRFHLFLYLKANKNREKNDKLEK